MISVDPRGRLVGVGKWQEVAAGQGRQATARCMLPTARRRVYSGAEHLTWPSTLARGWVRIRSSAQLAPHGRHQSRTGTGWNDMEPQILLAQDDEPEAPGADPAEKFLPRARQERKGVALCLSGGGFRAVLFHLGALRRLNELGVLARLDAISSVSGGSIVAAHLATVLRPWPAETVADFESKIAAPLRAFTARNLRTRPILKRLIPWNWPRSSTGVEALAEAYHERLTQLTLSDLPDPPAFSVNATDMAFGVNWVFQRERMGSYQAGYARPEPPWLLARAVAASSCFPPAFNPLPIGLAPEELRHGRAKGPVRDAAVRGLRLTDGGNYDNLGLEPVWKRAKVVLVSDGGSTFDAEPDRNLIWRLSRYTAILNNQVGALRRRWLIANFILKQMEGTYWAVSSWVGNYKPDPPGGYSRDLVNDIISEVRTDLDAFSEPEQMVLENHGYIVTEAAIRVHQPGLAGPNPLPFVIPHPEWLDEARVAEALRKSHERKFPLGRW
jgi:NTE family protein